MHLFFIIVASILTAAFAWNHPGFVRNFIIGFFAPIILLVLLALMNMQQ